MKKEKIYLSTIATDADAIGIGEMGIGNTTTSSAVLSVLLDAACAIINDMATLDQAGIDDGYLDEIREGDKFTVEGAK